MYGKLTFASALRPPNPACLVCGHAVACVSLDMQTFTLQRLVEGVLKARMAFNHPMIVADDFLYEEGDDLEEDEVEENARHLPCALSALPGGLEHNARLHVTDQTQNMKLTLVLQQAVRASFDARCTLFDARCAGLLCALTALRPYRFAPLLLLCPCARRAVGRCRR